MQKNAKSGILRLYAILSAVMAVLLIASIAVEVYTSGQTKIFETVEYGASLQNSKIMVNDKLGLTFLGTYQNSVLAYDKDGRQVWKQELGGAVGALEYEKEKDWLIVGSQDRNVYVFSAQDGQLINKYSVNGKVYDLDLIQETGEILVSAGVKANKQTLYILDIHTGEEILKQSLTYTVRTAAFTADRQNIVYGDGRGRVTLVDREGKKIAEGKMRGDVYELDVNPVTGQIVAIDDGGYLDLYDANLNLIRRVELTGEGRCVSMSEDGKWLAAGTREGDIYILNGNGDIQFHVYENVDISQVYFGESRCFAVTLSLKLYEFSEERLNSIGTMSSLAEAFVWVIALNAVLLAAMLICTFGKSRNLGKRFFRALYRHRTAYLMLAPSIVLILIFNYYNVFQAFYYAFTDWSLATKSMREVNFIGLDNFSKMLSEGYFLLGVKNLLILIVASFAKLLTVPLFLAEIVFAMRTRTGASSKRRYWFRLLLVVPMVVPGVVNALMWKNMYDPNIGALNSILDVVGLGNLKHAWLGDTSTALGAIIFMGFPWVNSFAFLVFYGGLINIPEDLFEAAKVDGSTPMWNFLRIHLPLITPQLKMLIITTFIGVVQDYGGIYLLTGGGPGTSTYVPGLELYYAATKFGQYGYACAMGIVLFVVILVGSLFNLRMKTQEIV